MAIMSDGIVVEVADRLWQAEINRTPISPITDAHPELGIEDAYAIQSHNQPG
jgi:2-keto-4-pentenoate hydratase